MESEASQLQSFLAAADVPCPSCNYNLRGLNGSRCPECNQELSLRVGLVEPRIGGLIAAASGLLAGAGAGLVILSLVILISIDDGPPDRQDFVPIVLIPLLGLVVEGSLAIALLTLKGRRWFREQNHAIRVATIALGWFLTAAGVLIVFVTAR